MKAIVISVFTLFQLSLAVQAQFISLKAGYSFNTPRFSVLRGNLNNASVSLHDAAVPFIEAQYGCSNGILVTLSVAHMHEQFDFSERAKMIPALSFAKKYTSSPFGISLGYSLKLHYSFLHLMTSAGWSAAFVHTQEIKSAYNFDGLIGVTDQQGNNYTDTVHIVLQASDSPLPRFYSQINVTAGIRYDLKRFFLEGGIEGFTWLKRFETISYHTEHSSAHQGYSQTTDGKFSLQTGYVGVRVAVGWYFTNQQK